MKNILASGISFIAILCLLLSPILIVTTTADDEIDVTFEVIVEALAEDFVDEVSAKVSNPSGQEGNLSTEAAVSDQETKLYWKAGDILTGELLEADSKTLTWKSSLFVDPLKIEASSLTAIRFPETKQEQPISEPFRLAISKGDVLFGTLLAASDEEVEFKSSRHGQFKVLRENIETIKRINTPDLVYLGPRGIDGWVNSQDISEAPDWHELSNGYLTTSTADRGIFRHLDLPDQCEIELILESTKMPAFILALGQHRNSCLRIESWAEVLVVLSRFQFVEVQSMPEGTKRVHLNLFLNQKENRLSIYSRAGEKLAEIVDKRGFIKSTGIQLWNRGDDLTLNYLRVDRWNGELPKPLKVGQSRIQLTDGTVVYGKLPTFAADAEKITIGEGDEKQDVTIDQMSQIVVNDGEGADKKSFPTSVSWKEGGYVSGEIFSIKDDRLSIKTEYTKQPIESSLVGIQRISLPNSAAPPENMDQIFFTGGSLRGELVIDGKTETPIRWTPVGGMNASALSNQGNARFVRGQKGQELTFDPQVWSDILYLVNGDVIPCQFLDSNEDRIKVKIPFSDVSEIPVQHVKALEFSSEGKVSKSGFNDESWKRTLGRPKKSDDTLEFQTSGGYGHESILTGDVVKFRLKWGAQQYSQMIIQMYGNRLGNDSDSTNIQINVNANRLWVEEHQPQLNGQLVFNAVPQGNNNSEVIRSDEGVANVTLAIREGKVHVIVNDQLLKTVELKGRRIRKKSLAFNANINSVTRNVPYGDNPLTRGFVIDQFEIRNHDGTSAKQFILEETRDKALLIPRFRRENPSTHVVLAPNGDVLRGRLIGISDDQVQFESQLEEFGFARDRIASVIWLHPKKQTDDEKPDTENVILNSQPEMQLKFGKGFLLSMDPEKVENEQLVGKARSLGVCSIPAGSIQEVILGEQENRSKIVSYSQWIPKYAAEPDWEIPEESGSGPAQELVGTTAEDFELASLDGTTFRLEEHEGKVVVLDFWASWCGPCVAALPDYIQATSGFDPAQVIFVAVNLQESPQVVRGFLKAKDLDPHIAMDETGGVASRFKVSGIPHTVILSPGLKIEEVHVGYRQNAGEEMRQAIEKMLDGTYESAKPKEDVIEVKPAEE